jgi:predicted O-methyltransferase YrrM
MSAETRANAVDEARAAVAEALCLSRHQPAPEKYDDSWALAADALQFLAELVRGLRPHHIVEFGSGRSTRMFLEASRGQVPVCRISSVDHDPDFCVALDTLPDRERVKLLLAPLVLRNFAGDLLACYRFTASDLIAPTADLVLIDGPPAALGGREGTLLNALALSRPGTIIVLDDAAREQEDAALRRLGDSYGDALQIEMPAGFKKGLGIVIVGDAAAAGDLWQARIAATRAEIGRVVPQDQVLAVIGEEWWAAEIAPEHRTMSFAPQEHAWSAPADDREALRFLQVLRQSPARWLALAWPDYWWKEAYPGCFAQLAGCERVQNSRLTLFELKK